MKIPSANIHLTAKFGQEVSASSSQFGNVSLKADGRIEDSFKQLPGHDRAGSLDLSSPKVCEFFAAAAEEILKARSLAAQLSKYGVENAGLQVRQSIEGTVNKRIQDQMGDTTSRPRASTSESGALTSVALDGESYYGQTIKVSQSDEGLLGLIETRRYGASHKISIPFSQDGVPQFEHLTEEVRLETPWITKPDYGQNPINEISDPRLERLATAAELGMLLTPNEMGEGWQSKVENGHQIFTTTNEKVELDPSTHSFTLTSQCDRTARGGEVDYTLTTGVRFENGKFTQLPSKTV